MVSQIEALAMVKEHPDFSAVELTDLNDWGDLKKFENYKARNSYRCSLINKLYRLEKFGMVERGYDNGRTTWRAVE